MTLAYPYRGNLYLNVTNRCPVACVFCLRRATGYRLAGHDLRLRREPSAEEVAAEAEGSLREGQYEEVVFCGMGEPLMRPDVVAVVAERLKRGGARVRVDTCGLGNLVHGRDLTAELAPFVDALSISLNAGNADAYAAVCPSPYGREAFAALLDFVRLARGRFASVTLSVVHPDAYERQGLDCPVDLEECRRLADSLGLPLRVRGAARPG